MYNVNGIGIPGIPTTQPSLSSTSPVIDQLSGAAVNTVRVTTDTVARGLGLEGDPIRDAIRVAGTEAIAQGIQGAINNITTESIKSYESRQSDSFGNSAGGGGGTGGVSTKPDMGMGGNIHVPHYVDPNSTAVVTKLSTDIVPNLYTDMYLTGDTANYAYAQPMHMNGIKFNIPSSGPIYDFFTNILCFDIRNRLQGAVSFSVLNSLVTPGTILSAYNAILNALQTLYFFDSILSYTNNPLNRNEAMLHIRSKMTPTDLNNLYSLRRILAGTPIPPNMREFCFYMMQTFATSAIMPNCSLLKLCPVELSSDSNGESYPTASTVPTLISSLDSYNDTFSLIARACPNWVMPVLTSGFAEPIFDGQYNTMFYNMPEYTVDGTSFWISPSAENSVDIRYLLHTNDFDGLFYSLTSIFNPTTSTWSPSMTTVVLSNVPKVPGAGPLTTVQTNRFSFKRRSTGGFKLFYWSESDFYSSGRLDTYKAYNNTSNNYYQLQHCGTEIARGVNTDTIAQTAKKFVEWLMSNTTIGKLPSRLEFGGKSNNRGKPKGYKPRSKKNKSK